MKPEDLLFAETHEWAHISEQDGVQIATVGISAFAIEQLTDLVYLELPEVGASVDIREQKTSAITGRITRFRRRY